MANFSKTLSALQSLSASLSEVTAQANTAAPAIAQTTKVADDAIETLDVLDELYALNEGKQNDFSEKFKLGIQAVRIGAQDIRDFIATWGDASIATQDGFQTIREAFSGADLGQYKQQLQDLISDVSTGAAKLDDVLKFLKDNAGDLAKGLINVLELFKQGRASLEDVQRVLDATRETFPGLDADALADAIRNALIGGTL